MLVSRGSIFGTDQAAAHAHSRHEIAQSTPSPLLVFDCEGAGFEVISGDVHALPPNHSLAIIAEHSEVVVGVLETGALLESVHELASSIKRSFAKSVRFHAYWHVAADHGVDANGELLAYVNWTGTQGNGFSNQQWQDKRD